MVVRDFLGVVFLCDETDMGSINISKHIPRV